MREKTKKSIFGWLLTIALCLGIVNMGMGIHDKIQENQPVEDTDTNIEQVEEA